MIKTKYYYRSKLALVRNSDISDVFELAKNMRDADKKEIWKSHHRTPEEALLSGFTESIFCLTVEHKESPIAMFGVVPEMFLSNNATVWMLASPKLEEIQKTFIKRSKHFIDLMLNYYPMLSNFVDIENKHSIKWLKWCGAKLGAVVIYGVEKQFFQYFEFRR